jgi:hypothetical protein
LETTLTVNSGAENQVDTTDSLLRIYPIDRGEFTGSGFPFLHTTFPQAETLLRQPLLVSEETLAIYRSLELARAAFAMAVEEKPAFNAICNKV